MPDRREFIASLAAVTCLTTLARASATKQPRVLLVTGGHDFDPEFFGMFEGGWCVSEHVDSNEQAFARDLRGRFPVAALYDMNSELSEEGKQNLRAYLESGGGLVVMHHALVSYNGWEWWWREVTGGLYLESEMNGMPASTYRHDTQMTFTALEVHPVTLGMKQFSMIDETYGGMWFSERIRLLVESDSHQGKSPAVWIGPWTKGRVVCIQPGHGKVAFENVEYRSLVRRAVLWAAGSY